VGDTVGGAASAESAPPAASPAVAPPAPAAILRSVLFTVLYPGVPADDTEVVCWSKKIDALSLPTNPLDAIMNRLASQGVPAVELSGRQVQYRSLD